DEVVGVGLLHIGQDLDRPAGRKGQDPIGEGVDVLAWEAAVRVVEALGGDADLVQVVLAGGARGGLTDLLDGGQEHADEHRDDGDDDEQLDQREALAQTRFASGHGDGPRKWRDENAGRHLFPWNAWAKRTRQQTTRAGRTKGVGERNRV